jgi:dienelactone hydrolase
VDCDADTWEMDITKIEKAITPKTKAIIGVHLYGQPFDIEGVSAICKKHNLFLVEDAAQSQGARYNGKTVGVFGEMACYSFYPGKNLGACGEAGGITTNNETYAKHLQSLRNHGSTVRYYHDEIGYNYRMGGLEGASLNVKMKYIEGWNNRSLVALQDAQRAMRLIRSRAANFRIDPNRVGVIGFSAGGHLAVATATNFEKRSYDFIDDIDKISCRPNFAIPVYSGYLKAKDKEELASGIQAPTNAPPMFLVHGGEDIISPPEGSVLMYLALKKAGVPAELHIYANAAHDFGVRKVQNPCSTWTDSCEKWLRDQGFLSLAKQTQ